VIRRVEHIRVMLNHHEGSAVFPSAMCICVADRTANQLCIFFYNYRINEILPYFFW
jgi:hypothetical protein